MYERPGRSYYTVATKAVMHGDAIVENGIVGAAIKNTAKAWSAGFSSTYSRIEVGEKVNIRTKGIHQFGIADDGPGEGIQAGAKGGGVYIDPDDNALKLEADNAAGDLPFGRIVEVVADNRGVPADHIRIDLDQKDTLPAAS